MKDTAWQGAFRNRVTTKAEVSNPRANSSPKGTKRNNTWKCKTLNPIGIGKTDRSDLAKSSAVRWAGVSVAAWILGSVGSNPPV